MPIPWLQPQEKTCRMQRSRGFGHRVVVSKICYNAVIVLAVLQSDCCKPMNNCRGCVFILRGLEVGLPAFQLPMFAECHALPKEISGTCLFRESIPPFPFGIFNHPIPTRSLSFLNAAAGSNSSALWLQHAHPFVAVA